MGVIWFASGRPGDDIPLPGGWDKPAHFLEYAVLGFFLARALGETRPRWFLAWCLAVGYGLLDEYHQSFVLGRYPSGVDVLMDAMGAAAGVLAGLYTRARAGLFRGGGQVP
jgi:VanZ family protein